jgi:hypothetical protein
MENKLLKKLQSELREAMLAKHPLGGLDIVPHVGIRTQKNPSSWTDFIGSGGWIRTNDLRVTPKAPGAV